jgi:hypothetical protein
LPVTLLSRDHLFNGNLESRDGPLDRPLVDDFSFTDQLAETLRLIRRYHDEA